MPTVKKAEVLGGENFRDRLDDVLLTEQGVAIKNRDPDVDIRYKGGRRSFYVNSFSSGKDFKSLELESDEEGLLMPKKSKSFDDLRKLVLAAEAIEESHRRSLKSENGLLRPKSTLENVVAPESEPLLLKRSSYSESQQFIPKLNDIRESKVLAKKPSFVSSEDMYTHSKEDADILEELEQEFECESSASTDDFAYEKAAILWEQRKISEKVDKFSKKSNWRRRVSSFFGLSQSDESSSERSEDSDGTAARKGSIFGLSGFSTLKRGFRKRPSVASSPFERKEKMISDYGYYFKD